MGTCGVLRTYLEVLWGVVQIYPGPSVRGAD